MLGSTSIDGRHFLERWERKGGRVGSIFLFGVLKSEVRPCNRERVRSFVLTRPLAGLGLAWCRDVDDEGGLKDGIEVRSEAVPSC